LDVVKNVAFKIIIKLIGGQTLMVARKVQMLFNFDEPTEECVIYVFGICKTLCTRVLFYNENVFVLNNQFSIIGHEVHHFSPKVYIFPNSCSNLVKLVVTSSSLDLNKVASTPWSYPHKKNDIIVKTLGYHSFTKTSTFKFNL
jgi:hypothetical protein